MQLLFLETYLIDNISKYKDVLFNNNNKYGAIMQ